jgi:sporulation protein YlmC with PRC-barrel domain
MAYEENRNDRLEELSGSNFEIAENQPDITDWEIFDASGDYIGDVEDLIFDSESYKVRYIITALSEQNTEVDRLVLLPIGLVTLQEKEEEVILSEAVSANLGFLPTYQQGQITPAHELQIRDVLTGNIAGNVSGTAYDRHPDDFYTHHHFDDKGYARKPKLKDGEEPGQII